MRKHWLLFTQTVTIALALLFIVHTLKPELLPNAARSGVVTLYENTPLASDDRSPAMGLSAAAQKAMPSVVNIFTSTTIKTPVNPFMDDPRFKFFFGDQFDNEPQTSSSLGSGDGLERRRTKSHARRGQHLYQHCDQSPGQSIHG